MIYECPQCQKPQAAGQTVCPYCHAEFDGPVPDDAIVPAEDLSAAEATPSAGAAASGAGPGPMPLDPPRYDTPAEGAAPPPVSSGAQPYLTPPTYAPPPYIPPAAGVTQMPYTPSGAPLGRLTRVLLVAFPIVLVLVLGGVYFAETLNANSDASTEPPVVTRPQVAPPAAPPPPTGSPVLLSGGSNTNDGSDPRIKILAGRWVSKTDDFYVFNSDGTGSRGSTTNPGGDQTFLWGLVQNRLMLYGGKNEALRFSSGPDNDTVFLGSQTGRYVQYARAKS